MVRMRIRNSQALIWLTKNEDSKKNDKSYRRYASGVERALALFDTALQEWADYISFLGRLLKVYLLCCVKLQKEYSANQSGWSQALQAHPKNSPIIPYKSTVAKRLAQCMNPTLPSGVHQKALEVYAYIFSMIDVS
jgi:Dopey, N-terminal